MWLVALWAIPMSNPKKESVKVHTLKSDMMDRLEAVRELGPYYLESKGWKYDGLYWRRGDAKIADTVTAVLVASRSS
jgi:hypothetical protein